MAETKIRPQNLLLKISSTELTPSTTGGGMLWVDINNILRVDSVGLGNPVDFVTVLPEHTIDGHHGPKVQITQTAADNALVITKASVSAAVSINCITTNAGRGIEITSVSNTDEAFRIMKSGNTVALRIDNSGASDGLLVNQIGNGNSARFTQSNANNVLGLEKSNTGLGNVLDISNSGTGRGISVNQTGAGNGLSVTKSAGDASSAMIINNYDFGAGLLITQTGNGKAIRIAQSGTDNSIYI